MVTTRIYTKEEFFKFAERIEAKFEFDGKHIIELYSGNPVDESFVDYVISNDFENKNLPRFSMPTIIHDIIVSNLTALLNIFLKGKLHRLYCQGTYLHVTDEKKEEEEQDKVRVPDIMVVEKTLETRNKMHEVINPVVLIEVLSKSTQKIDKTEKLEEYQALESLQEYLMVSQNQPKVVIYRRISEKKWEEEIFDTLEETVNLTSLHIEISLQDIYEDVIF